MSEGRPRGLPGCGERPGGPGGVVVVALFGPCPLPPPCSPQQGPEAVGERAWEKL